jgi:hypothetical protein
MSRDVQLGGFFRLRMPKWGMLVDCGHGLGVVQMRAAGGAKWVGTLFRLVMLFQW